MNCLVDFLQFFAILTQEALHQSMYFQSCLDCDCLLDSIFLFLLAAIKTPGQNEMFDENQKQMEILLGQYNASQPIDEFVSGKVIIHKSRGDESIVELS